LLVLAGTFAALTFPNFAQADIWGGDVAVLMQILQENIRHYYQLQSMIQQGHDADHYLRWINAGLDKSIGLLQSLPIKDEKVLADLRDFRFALGKVQGLYGQVPHSPEENLQILQDQTVAESLRMANDFKSYSENQEKNADVIASEARDASPKGAARMQAETSAQILKSLAQLLRLDTQMLKLQSEQLAMNNKASKEGVANFQKVSRDLGSGFTNFNPDMKLTRF
jgi:hypothetical protein